LKPNLPQALQKKPEPAKPNQPELVSFALIKRNGNWNALAVRSIGREIVQEELLESDDTRDVARSTLERFAFEHWIYGTSPFETVGE
jgi:hypothetical protein